MEHKDITRWGDHCFNTLDKGIKEDDVFIYHPYGRNKHKGVLVFAFSVHKRFLRRDMVLWCFVNRDDFDKSVIDVII